MTIDDESLLSAYMDGQLSPDHQQLVESALIADTQLGEKLRRLSLVRDLVAGLSRDAPVDVLSAVSRRLRKRSRQRRIWAALPARVSSLRNPAWAAGMLSVAAVFLVALLLTFSHILLPRDAHVPAAATGPLVAPLDNSLSQSTAGVLVASESAWPSFTHTTFAEGASTRTKSEDHHPEDHRRFARESGELEHVSQYLDHPDLRRIFLVSDVTDGATQKRVASVVEETTRFNYFKITIAQGIVIDPRHPGEATVFALVVSPAELGTLRDRLRTALQDRVEEAPVDPTVVTQLADIGQVKACPPSPVADVEIPDTALANKAPTAGGGDEPAPAPDQPAHDQPPTPEQERSSPAAELARQEHRSGSAAPGAQPHELAPPELAGRGPRRIARSDQTFVVLVWVSRVRPG